MAKKFLEAAWKETEFDYKDESYQYSIFGWFRPSPFRCEEIKQSGSQITFYELIDQVSIDNLMDEMQPVVLENERFVHRKKIENFFIFWLFCP